MNDFVSFFSSSASLFSDCYIHRRHLPFQLTYPITGVHLFVHSIVGTAAKVGNPKVMGELLHGKEKSVHGDGAYTSNVHNLLASDPKLGPIWCIPFKRSPSKDLPEWKREINRGLSSLRAIGEHPFRILKRQFHFRKVRYRGLSKNTAAITTKFALANLYQVWRQLLPAAG